MRGEFDSLEITVVGAKAKSEALTQLIAHDEGNRAREKTTLLPTAVVGQTKRSVGHIASVMVKFSECEFDGVPFTELTVGLTNVRYDLQKLLSEQRIWLIDFANGWFVFKLPSSFVSSLIESEMTKSGLVKPVAKLHAQGIRVEASYPIWWLHIPFSVDGELVAVPPCKVTFKPKLLKVFSVIPMPGSAVERLIGKTEFSFELTELKMPLEPQLELICVTEGEVEFRGILRLPKAGRATRSR